MTEQPYVSAPPTPKSQGDHASKPFREREHPLRTASLLSEVFMTWLQPLISLGAKRALEKEDIWEACPEDLCEALQARLVKVYDPVGCPEQRTSFQTPFGLPRIMFALIKTFRKELTIVLASDLVFIGGQALLSLVAEAILDFLNGRDNRFHISSGYWLVVMMTLSGLVAMLCFNYAWYVSSRVGANMRSLLMDLIYQKSLRLSSRARQQYTTGEIVTLMSVDTERVFTATLNGPWIVLAPVAFLVAVVLIAFLFDVLAAVAGAVLLVAVVFTSSRLAKQIGKAQRELLPITEQRVKVTSEALQGIRVMKFYAWTDSVAARVEKIRRVEVKKYRAFHFWQILNSTLLFLTPVFLSGVTLGVFVAQQGTLTVTKAYTLLAVVNVTRQAVNAFPLAIAALSQANVVCSRIDKYLASDELARKVESERDPASQHSASAAKGEIIVRNGCFYWSAPSEVEVVQAGNHPAQQSERIVKSFALDNIDLEIAPGSLVMIVGTVGSGKSSLIQALLGEMNQTTGSVAVGGDVSYVGQEAWIRNSTVQSNIVFEADFDSARYSQVLEATQLMTDLDALPDRDLTEIGERGINLSGGQKARVSMARALYRPSYETLILDDPLSAVDPHVAHAIFESCIVGLAKTKTRLLVLNSHYDLLSRADRILVMANGSVVGDGGYADILSKFPDLLTKTKSAVHDHPDFGKVDTIPSDGNPSSVQDSSESDALPNDEQVEDGSNVHVERAVTSGALVQKEDRVKGRVSGYTYKTYLEETGMSAGLVVLLFIIAYTASQGLRVLIDWWQAYWAKNMQQHDKDDMFSYSSTRFALLYYGFIVMCTVVTVCRSLMVMELLLRSSTNLHTELFQRVLNAPVNTYFDVTPVGRILNRLSNDLDQMDSVLPQQYQNFVQNISLSVGGFIVCATASYWIGLSYLPMLAVLVLVGVYFKKSSREIKRLEGISRSPVFNLFNESLNGFQTIRAFKMQATFDKLNKQAVDENASFYFTYWAAGRWLAVRLDTLSVTVIFVVSLYLVATKGQIGAMIGGLSLTYAISLTSTVQSTIRDVDRTDNAMTSVERVLHFREIPQEIDSDDCVKIDSAVWPPVGAVQFDNVCLRYRPDLPLVLRGVNMSVSGGEKVGICGRTGAGKSSLMIALFRICEFDSGTIYIDGVDIQRLRLQDLRRSLAIIPQDPVLFSGSMRDNMDPFGEFADSEIWTVLKQVHLADTVASWGVGLDFVVSEKGDNLSVGQRQLICIARALLKRSKVVVLDEATANVDTATDHLIQETIKATFVTQTVLIIAHRINTIMHCDKIAVVDAGQVAEFGAPRDLLGRPSSMFAQLAKRSGHH